VGKLQGACLLSAIIVEVPFVALTAYRKITNAVLMKIINIVGQRKEKKRKNEQDLDGSKKEI
jgi:hypothetical protein